MSTKNITCDQAIFTSVRTPMGEGYRIIAASRGLRPDEKQAITRSSPSHDALCQSGDEPADQGNDVVAASFYTLPRERLCVALSCTAGAEHTGRGGHRVYTHCVVFDRENFPSCGYNPFVVLRAMVEAGLSVPQLKPPPVLPELNLTIQPLQSEAGRPLQTRTIKAALGGSLPPAWGRAILNSLLLDRSVIVNVPDGWMPITEALLMGVPGPMRQDLSFSAGLRFSVGRSHRLSLSHDEPGVVKSRIAGRSFEYVDPSTDNVPDALDAPDVPTTEWLSFVERHWQHNEIDVLTHRTSRGFANVTPDSRERVGRIYNQTDSIRETDTPVLLEIAEEHLTGPSPDGEADLTADLLGKAQQAIIDRWLYAAWAEVGAQWETICSLWRRSAEARRFTGPLVEKALLVAAAEHPATAAEAALKLVHGVPPATLTEGDNRPIDNVLERLAQWVQNAGDADLERLPSLCQQWRAVRPSCPIVERIQQLCTSPSQP